MNEVRIQSTAGWPGAEALSALFPEDARFQRMPVPRRDTLHLTARALLRAGGWRIGSPPPALERCVIVAAPHTAIADGFWMLTFAYWWGWRINWLVKHTVMTNPLARRFLQRTGAVPIDRRAPRGTVAQLVETFAERDHLLLAISPEGTRSLRPHWKSGFYRIAVEADVPICLSYLDYGRKEAGFGPCLVPTGDVAADMERIRAFYANITARHPELFSPARLPEEDGSAGST